MQRAYRTTRLILTGIALIPICILIAIALTATILNPQFKDYTYKTHRRNNENAMQIDFEEIIKRGLVSQNLENFDFYKGLHLHG